MKDLDWNFWLRIGMFAALGVGLIARFIIMPRFRSVYKLPERSLDDLKRITNVLFIDDKDFDIVQILVNTGWTHTRRVSDIETLDGAEIRAAHIIFVDIQGVGQKLKFKDEGLGIVAALKAKYPTKKVVVYSAEPKGDRFNPGLASADHRLPKNADAFQFQRVVEQFSREAFSLSECVARLKELLEAEFGVRISDETITRRLRLIGERGDVSEDAIARHFSLTNASAIASIIQVFLKS